jgi:hypothetical protein
LEQTQSQIKNNAIYRLTASNVGNIEYNGDRTLYLDFIFDRNLNIVKLTYAHE